MQLILFQYLASFLTPHLKKKIKLFFVNPCIYRYKGVYLHYQRTKTETQPIKIADEIMTTLDYYKEYYEKAKSYKNAFNVGDVVEVSITDVMPNPRCAKSSNMMLDEWNCCEDYSNVSEGPIKVGVYKNDFLMITDGHHRHKKSFLSGQKTIMVQIEDIHYSNHVWSIDAYMKSV